MIAPLRTDCLQHDTQFDPDQFLTLMPQIRRQASIAFRHRNAEAREEFDPGGHRQCLSSLGQAGQHGEAGSMAFPTPLAQFAIRQVRAGRRSWLPPKHIRYIVSLRWPDPRILDSAARAAGRAIRNLNRPTDRRSQSWPSRDGGGAD